MVNTKYTELTGKITEILERYNLLDDDTRVYPNTLDFYVRDVSNLNGMLIFWSVVFILLLTISTIMLVSLIVIGWKIKQDRVKYSFEEARGFSAITLFFILVTSVVYLTVNYMGGGLAFSKVDTRGIEDYNEQLIAFYQSSEKDIVEYKPYKYTNINLSNLPEVLYQTEDSIKTVSVNKYKEDPSLKEPVLVKRTLKKEYSNLEDWGIHKDYAVLLVPEGYDIVNNQKGTVTSVDTE